MCISESMWKIDFIAHIVLVHQFLNYAFNRHVSSDTHVLRIHDLDQRIFVGMFQYFVCTIRPDGDCFKSAGTCPYKTYVRISNTPRVSD